jgi:hypothetical protein
LRGRKVRSLVLAVHEQHVDRRFFIVEEIDHADSAGLAATLRAESDFANPARSHDLIARPGKGREAGNQVGVLILA